MLKKLIKRYAFLLILLIFLPYRLHDVVKPLTNITNFRQAQTATFTLNFYKNGINLFQTELDIFGMGRQKYLTLEFPLYEATVAILYELFFVSDMWGRAVSILAGLLGAWYLYRIVVLMFIDKKLAIITAFIFLAVPLNMYHQQDFLIEATVVFFLLAGFYYQLDWMQKGKNTSFFLALLFLSLGFVQKGVYGPFLLIAIAYYYIQCKIKSVSLPKFILSIIFPILLLFIWQNHVNNQNITNGQEYFTTYNPGHLVWNFGKLSDRLSISSWQFRIANLINGIFLKPGLLLFFIGLISIRKIKNRQFIVVWLSSFVIYFLLLFPIQSHIYYQMIIIPVVSVIMAAGIIAIAKTFHKSNLTSLTITVICVFFLWRTSVSSRWDIYTDRNWYDRITKVGQALKEYKYGILVNPGYDWNSVYTYYPKLKLLSVSIENLTKENIEKWRQSGYSYIILHEYNKYPDYLAIHKQQLGLSFLDKYKNILLLEDFKVVSLTD